MDIEEYNTLWKQIDDIEKKLDAVTHNSQLSIDLHNQIFRLRTKVEVLNKRHKAVSPVVVGILP